MVTSEFGGSLNLRLSGFKSEQNSFLSNQIITDLEHLASQTAAEKGLEVVGFALHAHTKPMTVQVQIRQNDGNDVSLDDCALFSTPMNEAIELSKLLKAPYTLEISSPGLSDVLQTDREFTSFKGFPIEVVFKDKQNSQLIKLGLLHERSHDYLLINTKGKMSKIPRKDIITVRLTSPTG